MDMNMERSLRAINLIMKVDPNNKDTRSLVIEAQGLLQSYIFDEWTAISFQHRGVEVIVFKDSDVDDLVHWVETMSPEQAPRPTTARQRTRFVHLGEEYVPYICLSLLSPLLNPN